MISKTIIKVFDWLLEYCLRTTINNVALTTNNQITWGRDYREEKPISSQLLFLFLFFSLQQIFNG